MKQRNNYLWILVIFTHAVYFTGVITILAVLTLAFLDYYKTGCSNISAFKTILIIFGTGVMYGYKEILNSIFDNQCVLPQSNEGDNE